MPSAREVLENLRKKANPANLEGMKRFGISTDRRLGSSMPLLREEAKMLGRSHALAIELWATGMAEAKILASMVEEPDEVGVPQMEEWVNGFDSWDICDQVCMNLFRKTPRAVGKIPEWSMSGEVFVKRASFALIACLATHSNENDEYFLGMFPLIKAGAVDDRNYVKKAVSWALRSIGKRNENLNEAAINLAEEIRELDTKAARWIGSDVLRELKGEPVKKRIGTYTA